VLSGDNLTKTRTDPAAAARARERYADAHALAVANGFDDLIGIIALRLADVGPAEPLA